jgi:hypothetical protein
VKIEETVNLTLFVLVVLDHKNVFNIFSNMTHDLGSKCVIHDGQHCIMAMVGSMLQSKINGWKFTHSIQKKMKIIVT